MTILKNKTVLITGGTGSFGQAFTDLLVKTQECKGIRIYSRSEYMQWEMQKRFKNASNIKYLIGDVRDRPRLQRAMADVDVVVHASALKQVPTCEYNPIEAVQTNVEGSANVINATIDCGVRQVIAISSDKAVHPVNLYGATKMVMEKLFTQANVYSQHTRFACTRYGNVVGSRGSVIPLFIEQAKTGAITITDERMTRFWLTLEQGTNFVLNCLSMMKGGEIFVPLIPSMKIRDLAIAIAPDAKVRVTGIRPGEKLHEVLTTEDEARHAKLYEDVIVIAPEFPFWGEGSYEDATGVVPPEGFRYTSDNNNEWLSIEQLKEFAFGSSAR